MNTELRKRFLFETEQSGRFIVKSLRTNKSYFVEAIGDPHLEWGSINQSSGELMTKKGWKKYRGSIEPKDSLITEENGFVNIQLLTPGISPMAAIDAADEKYPSLQV